MPSSQWPRCAKLRRHSPLLSTLGFRLVFEIGPSYSPYGNKIVYLGWDGNAFLGTGHSRFLSKRAIRDRSSVYARTHKKA
jgi:hypothetical protein